MKYEVAKRLGIWVNQKNFDQHTLEYVNDRLEYLRKQLEQMADPTEIYRLQGQIKETKRLLTLRDEVLQHSKKE